MRKSIGVVDLDMGNISSVVNGVEYLGHNAKLVQREKDMDVDLLILPGVGAFPEAMKRLGDRGIVQPLRDYCAADKPLLGICLGMQLLFDHSVELAGADGLGVVPGKVLELNAKGSGPLPHMGWNLISPTTEEFAELYGDVYFVHSYKCVPLCEEDVIFKSEYGELFCAGVKRNNIYGFQFHPEKSQKLGLEILRKVISDA